MRTALGRRAAVLVSVALCTFGSSRRISETDPRCPPGTPLEPSDTLLGYVAPTRTTDDLVVGPFRALALLRGSELSATDGAFIRDDMKFWPVVPADPIPVELTNVSSFMDVVGPDRCVFHAEFRGTAPPLWTLLSSKLLVDIIQEPTATERADFASLNTKCVAQGDYDSGREPPCTRPELLAVSDLDANGQIEYWGTEPYVWDTGITVWERDQELGLIVLLSVCSGCSD